MKESQKNQEKIEEQINPISIFENNEFTDDADDLLQKANVILNNQDLSKSNDKKLKEIDQLISDLEEYNRSEQRRIENSNRLQSSDPEYRRSNVKLERESPLKVKEYAQILSQQNHESQYIKAAPKWRSVHQSIQNDFETPQAMSEENRQSLEMLKDDGGMDDIFAESESKIPDDLSQDPDILQDHLLINQIADEYAREEAEGEHDYSEGEEQEQDEDDGNTPRGFYDRITNKTPQKKDKNMALQPYGLETEREQEIQGFDDDLNPSSPQSEELRKDIRDEDELLDKIHA